MSDDKKIKVVLLEPSKLARSVEIDASLEGMQKTVGGLIEPFYPFEEQVCIVCNEESKINGMHPNRSVKNDEGIMVDFIFGPAFICDCRGESLDSLSDEQINRYSKMFRYPERLARLNGELIGIPFNPQRDKERGLAGERSSLFFEIVRLLKGTSAEDQPEWIVLENVKNLLSVNRGWDFTTVLCALAEIGYHLEYGLLNSRFHGVPQNRERIYLVAYRHFRAGGGRKVFPVTASDGKALIQLIGGIQGKRVYDPAGISCTLMSEGGGFAGRTGMYFIDLCKGNPRITENARCLKARYDGGVTNRSCDNSGVLCMSEACPDRTEETALVQLKRNDPKIRNPKFYTQEDMTEQDGQNLSDVIRYAVNSEKTQQTDNEDCTVVHRFVSGINCSPSTARDEMLAVKKRFGKESGTVAYHGYQSFAPGEATPEMAHEIGKKLAARLWGGRYQVIVATHLDKENHLHNHFVLNTVSFVDGIKYHRTKKDYHNMQTVSDELCREYGLSVIEHPQRGKSKHYGEWRAEQEQRPTWRGLIRADIDEAIRQSMTERQFFENLRKKGYEIKTGKGYLR